MKAIRSVMWKGVIVKAIRQKPKAPQEVVMEIRDIPRTEVGVGKVVAGHLWWQFYIRLEESFVGLHRALGDEASALKIAEPLV